MSSDASTHPPGDAAPLLVTGCYRSGTTLLEKLLHAHPHATVASQPFPLLYVQVKEAFNASLGIARRYPLDHLFLEDGYRAEELHRFLDRFTLTAGDLARLFIDLEGYTAGLWTPEILQFSGQIRPGTFYQVFSQLLGCVARLFPGPHGGSPGLSGIRSHDDRSLGGPHGGSPGLSGIRSHDDRSLGGPALRVVGAKEVLCEEFVPYLLGKGARAIIIVRDPRDMILSLNFGGRDNKTGLARPILYSLRAWRKSLALAWSCEGQPGFTWLRYEDLVADTAGAMARVAEVLGLDAYDAGAFAGGLRDQRGRPWGGNSSFADRDGISQSSLGRFRDQLPPAVLAYIEAVCLPEMRAAGYQPVAGGGFDPAALTSYREPFEEVHARFPRDYSSDPSRLRDEAERHDMLARTVPLSPSEARRWFLHERAYQRLRATAGRGSTG